MTNPPPAERRWLPFVVAGPLLLWGGWLSVHRIFQVDEIQTMHMAWLMTHADALSYFNSADIYMIPMAILSRVFRDPIHYMIACRLAFLAVFVAAAGLLATAVAGGKRTAWAGALGMLGTLSILWDYGIEVRHDTVVLLGLGALMALWYAPGAGWTVTKGAWVGGIIGVLVLSSHKSIVLWGPILAWVVAAEGLRGWKALFRTAAAMAGGILAVGLAALAAHLALGTLPLYQRAVSHFLGTLDSGGVRFTDPTYFGQFMMRHPWLTLMTAVFLAWKGPSALRRAVTLEALRRDDPDAKCVLLLLTAPVFILLNPTPFPYNYVHVAFLAFPAAFRMTLAAMGSPRIRRGFVLSALLLLHVAPCLFWTQRHWHYRNDGQRRIVEYVNAATDPGDCVFDGAGLAMYRTGPGEMWYLHSLSRARYRRGELPRAREMLDRNPCPILVRSYKWNFMDPEDLAFIGSRYVPFRQVLWILGSRIPAPGPGDFPFEVHRDGLYQVLPGGTARVSVDDHPPSGEPLPLGMGPHVLHVLEGAGEVIILWTQNAHPPPIPEVSQPVFVNWY